MNDSQKTSRKIISLLDTRIGFGSWWRMLPDHVRTLFADEIEKIVNASTRPFTYLACPYTHPDPAVKQWRFTMANKGAAFLQNKGKFVFSPISSSHPIAEDGGLPTTWQYWKDFDYAFLRHCKEIFVLTIPGWLNSTGVQAELDIAKEMGIDIFQLDPSAFPHTEMNAGTGTDLSRESCCHWWNDACRDMWESNCGGLYSKSNFHPATPAERYCPGCGRPVVL